MPLLRACSGALATALAGGVTLWRADLFKITTSGGTVYRWTSWDVDLVVGGHTFTSAAPWLSRGRWAAENTMVVPDLEVKIVADNSTFGGSTGSLKALAHAGLFDGATLFLQTLFMPAPGDTTIGTVDLFSGDVGAVSIIGTTITMKVKGRNNRLDRPAPRNVYQAGCPHTFCDAGCTLSRSSFTLSYIVGTSPAPSATFVPFTLADQLSPPVAQTYYKLGSLTMTSGAASGQKRTIVDVAVTGLTLAYPLSVAPSPGDTFDAFQGCDKTLTGASMGGGNCTHFANVVNFRGFPFVPSPATTARGSF